MGGLSARLPGRNDRKRTTGRNDRKRMTARNGLKRPSGRNGRKRHNVSMAATTVGVTTIWVPPCWDLATTYRLS